MLYGFANELRNAIEPAVEPPIEIALHDGIFGKVIFGERSPTVTELFDRATFG